MAFVRGNDVKIGDICIFELVGKCEMLVHQIGAAAPNELAIVSCNGNKPSS